MEFSEISRFDFRVLPIHPETFYYRLTDITLLEFGIKDLFYLCFVKKKDTDKIQILKELHLDQQQAPHANSIERTLLQKIDCH